uniref:Uncharacterized protein n=1 Tax=Avena sativa TaxID=4498 RepID=A0ACD5U4K6_AVESA
MNEAAAGLGHLLVFAFLFCVGAFMVALVITDVTMAALCPGQDQCSLAIYLTGLQQAITGLGALVVTPVVGNLSDRYGRKALLGLPATLSIVPLAILAFNQTRPYFYAYYVAKTLTAMVSEGAMMCLSLAYVADKVPEAQRAAAFGVFSGVCTAGFVAGTIATRFLYVPGGNTGGNCSGGVHEGLRPGDGPRGVADARRGGLPLALRSILQRRGVVAEAPASREGLLAVGDGRPSYQQLDFHESSGHHIFP